MATKAKKAKVVVVETTDEAEEAATFGQKALGALAKAGAGAVLSGSMGAVDTALGDKAGLAYRATVAAAGLTSAIYVDPAKKPTLAALGNTALTSSSDVTGYKLGVAGAEKVIEIQDERAHKKMREQLRTELAGEKAKEEEQEGEPHPVQKKTRKKTNGAAKVASTS